MRLLASTNLLNRCINRRLLTEAYTQTPKWWSLRHDRVQETIGSSSFDPYELVTTVRKQYISDETVLPLELDLGIHCIEESQQVADLIDIIYNHRHSDQAAFTLASTHECVVRTLMHFEQYDLVNTVLADPLNYGIFPSAHTLNVFIDDCLQREDFTNAAKAAGFAMLQEMFDSSPLLVHLSLQSCIAWIEKNKTAVVEDEENKGENWNQQGYRIGRTPPVEMDDEMVMSTAYLKNPSFDYHFDLTQPHHIVGKTLLWATEYYGGDELVKASCSVLGGVLFEENAERMNEICKSGMKITEDTKKMCLEYIDSKLAIEEVEAEPLDDETVQVIGEFRTTSHAQWNAVRQIVNELVTESGETLVERIAKNLKKVQSDLESVELADYKANDGQKQRKLLRTAQVTLKNARDRKEKIEAEKLVLEEKQRVLSFFDNRAELERLADTDTSQLLEKQDIAEESLTEAEYASELSIKFQRSSTTSSPHAPIEHRR